MRSRASPWVIPAVGLVEEEEGGPRGEGAPDLEAALVAIGQVAGDLVGPSPESHGVEQLRRPRPQGPLFRLEAPVSRQRAPQPAPTRACMPTRTFSTAVMLRKRRMFWKVRQTPRAVI